MVQEFLDQIKIYETGLTKVRVGNKHDGGYVVLDEVCKSTHTVYAYGIGDDISFELDFNKKYHPSRMLLFDPTIKGLPEYQIERNKNIRFNDSGFQSSKRIFEDIKSYDNLIKIDVEGNELSMRSEWHFSYLRQISQLLIEFHLMHVDPPEWFTPYFKEMYAERYRKINNYYFKCYKQIVGFLNSEMYCFHAHANNSLPLMELDGVKFPPLIELSLVRKDLVPDAKLIHPTLPIPGLDFPNKTDRPDILGWLK